jgi:hypothetical protein
MPCCCNNIKHLCRQSVCGDIDTGIPAPSDGDFVLVLDYLGVEFRIPATFAKDEIMTFPAIGLNESYTYTGHIEDPSGDKLEFTEDAVEYNCLSFATGLTFELSQSSEGSS